MCEKIQGGDPFIDKPKIGVETSTVNEYNMFPAGIANDFSSGINSVIQSIK